MHTIRNRGQWVEVLNTMPVEGPGIRGLQFLFSSEIDWKNYKKFIPLKAKDIILDVGCGHGRMAFNFINSDMEYIGIDILPEAIKWADDIFAPWDNIRFYHYNIYNDMYHKDGFAPKTLKIDIQNKSITGILALSLFTHLETLDVVEHYLNEMRRVIRDCGTLVATFFVAPPNNCSGNAARTVFDVLDIYSAFKKCKFMVECEWGGNSRDWHDQRVYILRPF